jgi:hypothetical protein
MKEMALELSIAYYYYHYLARLIDMEFFIAVTAVQV